MDFSMSYWEKHIRKWNKQEAEEFVRDAKKIGLPVMELSGKTLLPTGRTWNI